MGALKTNVLGGFILFFTLFRVCLQSFLKCSSLPQLKQHCGVDGLCIGGGCKGLW